VREELSAIEETPSLRRDPDRLLNRWSLCGFLRDKVRTSTSNVQSPLHVAA
jgi:hypothetical protein